MIYSGQNISDALQSGLLVIDPLPSEEMFDTSAVDLRLGRRFSVFEKSLAGAGVFVNIGQAQPEAVAARYGVMKEVPDGGYLALEPGAFALGSTLERVAMPLNLAARVEGKSSVARFGLSIHQSAPTVHADFRGNIRLEISNVGPFVCRLIPGTRICQLIVEELKDPSSEPLRSRFQDQTF